MGNRKLLTGHRRLTGQNVTVRPTAVCCPPHLLWVCGITAFHKVQLPRATARVCGSEEVVKTPP
jgi:hypothetical protein